MCFEGHKTPSLPRGTADGAETEVTHDIREAKMEADSEARKFVARTELSSQRGPGLSQKLLWNVILVVERRLKSLKRDPAAIAATRYDPPENQEQPHFSGAMIRPSAHQRVEIQTHREDWP